MSPASPPDTAPAPLLCLYGAQPPAASMQSPPPGVSILSLATDDPIAALREVAAANPSRDVVLVHRAAILPPYWWPRLLAAAGVAREVDVLSPLNAADLEFVGGPRRGPTAAGELDALAWNAGDRNLVPAARWSSACSFWRGTALQRLDPDSRVGELAPACSAAVLDHLVVDGVAAPAAGEPMLAAVAARLHPLLGQRVALHGLDGKPVVLHVLHGWGGGAQRFVEDLASADRERHHLVLVARGDSAASAEGAVLELFADLHAAPLRRWPLAAPIAGTALSSIEYAAHFRTVLRDFGVGAVLVSSMIGHALDALRSGLPTAVVTHDYYPLWPVLHADFGDADRDFSASGIAAAIRNAGAAFQFSERGAATWRALRVEYVSALEQADALMIAPSSGVAENLRRIEPALAARRWQRIEHGFAGWTAPAPEITPDAQRHKLRIVVPGRIKGGKGEALLAGVLARLPADVELILLGGGAAAMRFFGRSHLHIVLDYDREALPALLASLQPDAALLASTVSETYSYLLSELWSLRVPVLATRLGSFAERIEHGRDGLLFEPTADALTELLADLAVDRTPLAKLRSGLQPPLLRSTADMASDYRTAVPASASPVALPRLLDDARAVFAEARAAAAAVALEAAQQALATQQTELERRAEWAHSQERLAKERTAWAKQAQLDAEREQARSAELQQEVHRRGDWAQTLLAETETLKQLVASEQRRLELEIEQERTQFAQQRSALAAERDDVIAQRDQMLASSSWRVTRPLRFARRILTGLPVRAAFQARRARSLLSRAVKSVRTRGIAGTLRRARQELRPPQPTLEFVLPSQADQSLPALRHTGQPVASIVIPVYNQFHHTRTCLQALAACADTTAFEVIVVDDGSSDETERQLADLPGLRYVRNPRNLGFIGACNAGAAQARGEFLIFLNNDTAAQSGWIDALLATFAQHDRVGLAGAKLVYPDGRLQEAGGIVFSDASGWNYGRFDDPADPRYNYVREVDYCSGAAIAIRKSLFDGFGGFDVLYAPAYYEDTDLAMKVRAAGWRVLYQPASVVVHFEGVTSGTDTAGTGIKRFQVVNQVKFLERWREVLSTHPAPGTDIAVAREHRAPKRVLMIDATTPQPDHDSGSLRLVNCMRVLRSEGHAVTFFADNRAWIERYTADLLQLGVEVLWHPWLADTVRWFAENGRRFDLVFISRHYIASSYVGLVRLHAPQARLVFDTVDLHYLREQREAELANREDLAHAADATRTRELALIRSADVTLVVSPVEQELLRREAPGARVEVLSNVHEVFGCRRGFSQRRDLMFMGGFQHPPNVDAATWLVQDILPLVRAQLPDVKLHLIGSKAGEAVRALGHADGVVFEGFVPDIEPFLDGCRLAIAPLRYGAGVKGKVNMSMSYGQPVVATPIAVEGMYAEAGRDVLVADDADALADEIVRAYSDEALWNSLSAHGLENVRRHFSFDAARDAVRRLFED